ncbi:hypothetical protein [Streptomyces sp. NPDC086835]|uniref:baeRF2 domain-containing protein n=1 Tax=Streptomyces sp. NPDC086835 TaxID=3365761 RepID=UPI0038302FAF
MEPAGQDPACLVAYIDRTGTDCELRGAGRPQDAGQVQGQDRPVHRTGSADWSERHFQLKVENTWDQNAAETTPAPPAGSERCSAGRTSRPSPDARDTSRREDTGRSRGRTHPGDRAAGRTVSSSGPAAAAPPVRSTRRAADSRAAGNGLRAHSAMGSLRRIWRSASPTCGLQVPADDAGAAPNRPTNRRIESVSG